ncbi:MAG TPA: hemolysin family protein [Amaricoccus sp.]|jgi:magnesium and cobalt transporter|nr:hemolysin family protein [Amaricoccus sp.]
MADLPDGHAAVGPQARDDEDPDSPGRSFFSRLFRREPPEDDAPPQDGGARGVLGRGARELLVNLRNLRKMRVEDVSVPRADISAISEAASLPEVVEAFKSSRVSRLPVYGESLDQPLGLVHLKDLALTYGFDAPAAGFDLHALVRPLLYAPPSMPIGVLLQKMQAARIHMALVIDEYGGVDGLVTIEDLLEQVVGDIDDEHDEVEGPLWAEEAPGVYLVQARTDLDAFEAATGIRLTDRELAEEVDTLGGLVIRLAGRVPARGELVRHPEGHAFEVLDADARRMKRLRLRLASGSAAEAAE